MLSQEEAIYSLNLVLPDAMEKAGKVAMKIQESKNIEVSHKKFKNEIEEVTNADITVQSIILRKLLKTNLKNCHIIAEESTKSIGTS